MAQDSVLLIREKALPIRGGAEDWDALLSLVGEARFVVFGRSLARYARILQGASEPQGFFAASILKYQLNPKTSFDVKLKITCISLGAFFVRRLM